MLGEIGSLILALTLAIALYTAFAAYWGLSRKDQRWADSARNGVYAIVGLLTLAFVALGAAFVSNDFRLQYVVQHSMRSMPLYLKLSAVWAGQEGSLLLWCFLQGLFTLLAIARPSDASRPLVPWATVFLNGVTAFFVGVTWLLSNPFALVPSTPPLDGQGLSVLLRHPGMIFHPPALYIGYVGLAVPAAFAFAALAAGKVDQWLSVSRRWLLVSWLFLGLGLLLGARWAYDVLGWGGYWAWDPVENAGLLPWLTATALLHGTVMEQERRSFRLGNILLAVFSFVLVLFGTFTTRSGMIQSVHAFARSNLGPFFLAFMGVTVAGAVGLLIWRREKLASAPSSEGFLSRYGMFLLTLVLLLTLTFSVLIGSLLPTITEALTGQRFEAGPAWFDRVSAPQFGALVLVLGLCPLLGQGAAALKRLRRRGWPALIGAVAVPVVLLLLGFTKLPTLIGFAVIGLATATTLAEGIQDIVGRCRATGEKPWLAVSRLFERQRRKYGGQMVHVGVVLMAIGIVGSRAYALENELVLAPNESAQVGRYTLVYEELRQDPVEDYYSTTGSLSVYQDGAYLVTLQPRLDEYPTSAESTTRSSPALKSGLREDLYVVLAGWQGDTGAATFKIFINPLINFLWLGGLLLLAGGVLAAYGPLGRAVDAPAAPDGAISTTQRRRRVVLNVIGLALGLALFVGAGLSMWGTGHGAIVRAAGRPLVGQTAPDFRIKTLSGADLSLASARGKVTVVNFWASWCKACEQELPDLQAVWSAYQPKGVVFIGIAYQDETAAAQATATRYGLTYALGLDPKGQVGTTYGITGVPETFVLDAQGRSAFVHIGQVSQERLKAELDSLVGK